MCLICLARHSLMNMIGMQSLSKACGTSLCSTYNWQEGPWSTCSAACGVGAQNRTISCMLNGQPADSPQCHQLSPAPAQQQPCYAKPCPASSWRLGPWTPCYQGSESRNVSCVAANGTYLDDNVGLILHFLCSATFALPSNVQLRSMQNESESVYKKKQG